MVMCNAVGPDGRRESNLYNLAGRAGVEYFDDLERASADVRVLHPGPMNRGVEIDSALADSIRNNFV